MPSGSVPTVSSCHDWSDDTHRAEIVTTLPKDQALTTPHWPLATVTDRLWDIWDTESYMATQ